VYNSENAVKMLLHFCPVKNITAFQWFCIVLHGVGSGRVTGSKKWPVSNSASS